MWVFMLLNYFFNGGLTIITIILTEYGELHPKLRLTIPWFFGVAQVGMLIVYYTCLKAMGQLHPSTAMMVTVVSVIPLYFSGIFALAIAESAVPGTVSLISQGIPGAGKLEEFVMQVLSWF